jgi:hypothetical protein
MKCELKLMTRGFIYFIKHITIYYISLMVTLSVLFYLFMEYTPWYIGQVIGYMLTVILLSAWYMLYRDECG